MKKVVVFVLLLLVFICSVFATSFDVSICEIVQEENGTFSFLLGLVPSELEKIKFTKPSYNITLKSFGAYGELYVINDDFLLGREVDSLLTIEGATYSFGKTLFGSEDTPLLYKNDDLASYRMSNNQLKKFLSALLNDRFVCFDLTDQIRNDIRVVKTYWWDITSNVEKAKEALAVFNKFMEEYY